MAISKFACIAPNGEVKATPQSLVITNPTLDLPALDKTIADAKPCIGNGQDLLTIRKPTKPQRALGQ